MLFFKSIFPVEINILFYVKKWKLPSFKSWYLVKKRNPSMTFKKNVLLLQKISWVNKYHRNDWLPLCLPLAITKAAKYVGFKAELQKLTFWKTFSCGLNLASLWGIRTTLQTHGLVAQYLRIPGSWRKGWFLLLFSSEFLGCYL